MLPSMPIIFTSHSQDAFGNKILPSTSFFHHNLVPKPVINPEPPPEKTVELVKTIPKEIIKEKPNARKQSLPPDDNALEIALVRSYYTKVQSRFASNATVPTNKFIQFRDIMKTFDPSKETPANLYRKVEKLFGEEHKDIVEEFLLFLKPGQAAEVGRFMDHFMMIQLTGFIQLLQTTFSRKPTMLRKILRALTSGINSGNSAEMKNRVLPHLRSNPRLTQMFRSLFPDEQPPESVYESGVEVLNDSFLTEDNGCDSWEFEEKDDKGKPEVKDGLDTLYLHGRVFLRHGRLLRTARVTFPYSKEPYRVHARRLAPTHTHLSAPDSTKSKKLPSKKPRQHKSPKSVKDVNDNTKQKEVLNSPKVKKTKTKTKKEDLKDKKKDKVSKSETKLKAKIETLVQRDVKNWTRDEDKTMLEVLKGEEADHVFLKIKQLLPHRSPTEIKERFCHVMSLLQKMAVGEVT